MRNVVPRLRPTRLQTSELVRQVNKGLMPRSDGQDTDNVERRANLKFIIKYSPLLFLRPHMCRPEHLLWSMSGDAQPQRCRWLRLG